MKNFLPLETTSGFALQYIDFISSDNSIRYKCIIKDYTNFLWKAGWKAYVHQSAVAVDIHMTVGHVIAQRLDAGFPPRRPGSRTGSMWGLWWTKRHWGRFSPSTSVSPANHSTNFSSIIITRGWHNRPISGRSVEWTLIPPPNMQI
jgi:hypothetical protein